MSRSLIRAVVTSVREHVAQATTKTRTAVSGMRCLLSGTTRAVCFRCAGRVCVDQAPRARRRASEFTSRLTCREPAAQYVAKPGGIDPKRLASKAFALCLCATEPRLHALNDQAALQLRDGGDDREHRLTERRAGVDLFAEGDELHVEMAEEFERLDQVPHGASEGVERGNDDHIQAASLHVAQEAVQTGAHFPNARDARVAILGHVVPSTSLAVCEAIVSLGTYRLLRGRNAEVATDALHRAPPSKPSSARDRNVPRSPSTMWSSTLIPTRSPTSQRRFVSAKSSAEGVASPLGWLWTRIRAALEPTMAALNTSRW